MSVRVKLKAGHPKRVMRARLSDGRVLEIDEKGVDLASELVSGEMRRCGWFVVGGKAGEKPMPNTEARRDEGAEGESPADQDADEPIKTGDDGDQDGEDESEGDLTQSRGGAESAEEKPEAAPKPKPKAEKPKATPKPKPKAAKPKATAKPKTAKAGK